MVAGLVVFIVMLIFIGMGVILKGAGFVLSLILSPKKLIKFIILLAIIYAAVSFLNF